MYIVVDKDTNLIIDKVENIIIQLNKFLVLSKGSLIQLDFINTYEVEHIPEGMKYYKNNKFYAKSPIEVEEENEIIFDKLKELDYIIPRVVEDIVKQGGFQVNLKVLEVIQQKEELRKNIV
jgi:hypothetical protein